MFGALNTGKSEKEASEIAVNMLDTVGLGYRYHDRDPFSLSNAEKRLVALAGVLAVSCSILVLDEVTAGLDYKSEKRVFDILKKLQKNGMTIIEVSHRAGHDAVYADRYVQMENGHIVQGARPSAAADEFLGRFTDPHILTLLKEHIKLIGEGR